MAHPHGIVIFSPLVIGVAVTFCTIFIHAVALAAIVQFVRHEQAVGHAGVRFSRNVLIVAGATMLALAAHLVEMTAWGFVLVLCGEFRDLTSAFYQSAGNYTSLGNGAVVMSATWRLLGPLETTDGMLMFGVSTAMIFAVIQRMIQARLQVSPN